ncbi:hypothetical protein [Indiicoccus explosivorum]|nr:hypothetical protein [Indiicoccus explosivorum]
MFWRPIVAKVLTYSEAIEMSQHQLLEVNAAIDLQIEKDNAANR